MKNKLNRDLLILGAGGHGRVVKETAESMGCFDKIDFLDDCGESSVVIGSCSDFKKHLHYYFYAFPAFGNNELRLKWLSRLTEAGFTVPVLIHSASYVSTSARIGEGSIVEAKAVVNTNVVVEEGCIISIGALVDHDSYVERGVHINSGAIVKAGCKVNSFRKIDAGIVYQEEKRIDSVQL